MNVSLQPFSVSGSGLQVDLSEVVDEMVGSRLGALAGGEMKLVAKAASTCAGSLSNAGADEDMLSGGCT